MAIDIDERKVARNEFGLWFGWTAATTVGMLLGFLPWALLLDNMDLGLARILMPLWAGLLVGMFQWMALRGYLTHSTEWIINGGAGWAAGFALGLIIIQELSASVLGAIIGYLLFGAIIGLLQWPVLHREIPSALPWVAASVVGWAAGALISQLILGAVASGVLVNNVVTALVSAGITGLIAGAITGLALIWIVRKPEV